MKYLKRCPFCGGVACVLSDKWDNGMKYYYAGCLVCGVRTPHLTDKDEAIKRWNRRVVEDE
jgi:Lar family restriction alleviation protein